MKFFIKLTILVVLAIAGVCVSAYLKWYDTGSFNLPVVVIAIVGVIVAYVLALVFERRF